MTVTISGTTGIVTPAATIAAGVGGTPAFRIRADANQSLSGVTKILFPATNYDKTGNVASSRFTAPVDGIYGISASIRLVATSWANCFCYLYKNGGQYSVGSAIRLPSAVSSAPILVLHDQVLLSAGEYIEIFASIDGTAQTAAYNDISTCSFFSGFLARAA